MKKGFFRTLTALCLGLFLMQLSGCATLFDIAAEDEADFDRGYSAEEYDRDSEAGDDSCRGRNCHTDSEDEADYSSRSLASLDGGSEHFGTSRVRQAIQTRDVILGMTRQDVMASWGEPNQREIAGHGANGHERWTYGSRYSLGESRTVIFENGKVAGWRR
jgi:hypothetical protein